MKRALLTTSVLAAASLALAGTPTIDGTLDAAAGYTDIDSVSTFSTAQAPGDNEGFGSGMDASAIYITEDASNIYLFVQCKGDTSNSNGVMILLGTSGQTGLAADTAGIGAASGGHAFDGNGGSSIAYTFEFEVDHAWVANTGSSSTNWFIDAVSMPGGRTTSFTGNPGQSGASTVTGAISDEHAFNNGGSSGGLGSSTGWEIRIPRSSLGSISTGATIQAFAVVVSDSAFFSSDCVPAAVGSNPGFDAVWSSQSGTQTHNYTTTLPVELDSFVVQ